MLDNTGAESFFSPVGKLVKKRISSLEDNLITIYVGGETPNEIKERKDRYDDVVLAVQSALNNGVLEGCGVALKKAGIFIYDNIPVDENNDYNKIVNDFVDIRFSQWAKLLSDVGYLSTDKPTVEEARNTVNIIDLATGDEGNPLGLGVVDTAYASITALKGGFSTAKILANANSIILTNKSNSIHF